MNDVAAQLPAPAAAQTLAAPARLEQVIRHSRFLAEAEPVEQLAQLDEQLARLCASEASHHCWAWRYGDSYRSFDDGEPGGTAGRPILAAIDGQGLDRVLVVVTRWFGGTKLGSGGLVRAYGGTAAECLRLAERVRLRQLQQIQLRCAHADLGLARHCLGQFNAEIAPEEWLADAVLLTATIDVEQRDVLAQLLRNASSGRLQIST